VNLPW